jgi:hypothetical protein
VLEGLKPPKSKSEYCKIDLTLKDLSKGDAQILLDAIANTDLWGAKTLSNALREKGLSIADTTITKHRKKICACYRGK